MKCVICEADVEVPVCEECFTGTVQAAAGNYIKLMSALKGLGSKYHDGSMCFCDMRIGNPMCKDHSDACKAARDALGET